MAPDRESSQEYKGLLRRWLTSGAVAVFLVWTALAATLMANAYWKTERITRTAVAEAEARAAAGAAALEQFVLRSLHEVEVVLALMADLGRYRGEDPQWTARLERQVLDWIGGQRFGAMQAGFVDDAGQTVWSAGGGNQGIDVSSRPHIRAILDGHSGTYVSAPTVGMTTPEMNVFFTRAVRSHDGRLLGVAVAAINVEAVSRGLNGLLLRPADTAILRRTGDGVLLARSGASAMEIQASPPNRTIADMRGALSGVVELRSLGTGREIFAGYRILRDAPLAVVFSLDRQTELREAMQAVRAEWLAHVALACATGIAVALLAMFWRRRESAMRLRETNEVLGAVPAIIVRGEVDAQGHYTRRYLSPGVEAVTGWPAVALDTPEKLRALSDSPDHRPWDEAYASLRSGDSFTLEHRLRRPDGRWMWLRTHGTVFRRHPDGRIEFTSYIVDISHERELAAQAAATAKLATLGEVATGLAHELNQPIAVMMLAAENAAGALEDELDQPPQGVMQRLRRIGEQGERAKVIIDHLRLFGHPGNDTVERVEIAKAIEGAGILIGAAMRQARIALEVAVPDALPPVRAQLVRLEQVLANLAMNARDVLAKRPDGMPRWLRIAAREERGRVVIEVADNGGGIPPDVLPRIFEPFVTTKGPGLGTGLGLSICHGIVHGYGGEITAENGSEGAIFTIVLPIWHEAAPPQSAPPCPPGSPPSHENGLAAGSGHRN